MALWIAPPAPGNQHAHVVQVANGVQHALLLTDEGVVYSWGGKNDLGQLGRTSGKEKEPAPVADCLRNEVIVQIACGLNHCLVLSQNGALFAWGSNKAGQLGIEGFQANFTAKDLEVGKPTRVHSFNGEDHNRIAKSISCGPESSACVTTKGEVYVWGAISYYLFGAGKSYAPGENCTKPVKVRGVPEVCRSEEHRPDHIALFKDRFVCTIARASIKDELAELIRTLKSRSSQLLSTTRAMRQASQGAASRGHSSHHGSEELQSLDDDLRARKQAVEARIREIEDQRTSCRAELQRIGRELTICDQQETALTDFASTLEVKRSEMGAAGSVATQHRALETQLNDISHFKSSNKRSKLQFFEQRDQLERDDLRLSGELAAAMQERQQVEARGKLIRSLQRGDLGGRGDTSVDEGLKIATSKRLELAATDPQTLAGAGRFDGFREVLAISDRSLQDVASALKEVSSVASGSDGVLEAVLEANLKLRKECNAKIQEKLILAEQGSQASQQSARSKSPRGSTGAQGMVQFFQEISKERTRKKPPKGPPPPKTGFLGLPASGFFGAQ